MSNVKCQILKKIISGRINGKGEGWLTGFTSKYIFLLLCIVVHMGSNKDLAGYETLNAFGGLRPSVYIYRLKCFYSLAENFVTE
jgi:hypothetical protein